MNKRIWSIAVALAMLLSMVCSAFVVSAAETQSAAQIEEEQAIIEEIELLQEAPLLATDASTLTSLKLSPSSSDIIAVGSQFNVGLSLENYNNDWATFAATLTYDAASVEYLSYDASSNTSAFEVVDINTDVDGETGTLTITWLNKKGENVTAASPISLMDLEFKAIAEKAPATFTAIFVEDSVAGYDAEYNSAFINTDTYNTEEVSSTVSIAKMPPYLTIRLIEPELDAEGEEIPVTSIEQGKELYAIVTLNDYYDPWMAMTLSLNYDSSLFTYVETDDEDLDAFDSTNGKMTVVPAETDDENAPLSVCFMSSDLSNRPLKDGKTTADVLKLKFVVNSDAEPAEDVTPTIGTSFVEDGNLKTDPETEETITLTPDSNDFKVEDTENGTASVTIETIERPYLSLDVVDSEGTSLGVDLNNMKVEQGDSFTVQVKINNFKQQWSMMSLFAQFDSTIFEIPLDTNGDPDVEKGVFGDYMVPVLMDNTLGVTLYTSGPDAGLTDGATEGIILEIPLKVKDGAVFSSSIEPFKVFFDTEGNYSGGELVSEEFYKSKQDDPATIIMKVKGQPQVVMVPVEDSSVDLNNLKAGDQVQFKVSVKNFIGAWSTMTLLVNFNSDVFELVDGSVINSEPFNIPTGNTYPTFDSSESGGLLLACWFNGVDLPMNSAEEEEVMTFTLQVKDSYTVDDLTQYISIQFDEEGNYAEGNLLTGSVAGGDGDYINTPVEVEVAVVQPEISVSIDWGAAVFTYDFGTWDPGTHTWLGSGWKWESADGTQSNCLKVTNDGTAEITAVFTFEGSTGVSGNFYEDEDCSSQKTEVTVSGSESTNVYFMPEGEPTETVEVGKTVTIGTIIVTIE